MLYKIQKQKSFIIIYKNKLFSIFIFNDMPIYTQHTRTHTPREDKVIATKIKKHELVATRRASQRTNSSASRAAAAASGARAQEEGTHIQPWGLLEDCPVDRCGFLPAPPPSFGRRFHRRTRERAKAASQRIKLRRGEGPT